MKTKKRKTKKKASKKDDVSVARRYLAKVKASYRAHRDDEHRDKVRDAEKDLAHAIRERKSGKASKPKQTMTVHELVSELARALSTGVAPDERKRITLRVSTAKQSKKRKTKARRRR